MPAAVKQPFVNQKNTIGQGLAEAGLTTDQLANSVAREVSAEDIRVTRRDDQNAMVHFCQAVWAIDEPRHEGTPDHVLAETQVVIDAFQCEVLAPQGAEETRWVTLTANVYLDPRGILHVTILSVADQEDPAEQKPLAIDSPEPVSVSS